MPSYLNPRDSDIEKLKNRVNMLEGEISRLRQEIKALAIKFESARIPMEVVGAASAPKSTPPPPAQRPAPAPVAAPEPEKLVLNFYLSTPNADGSFNNSSASPSYKESASIYKFQNFKDNRAKFKIDEHDASVKLALAYPDKNIDPVCDAQNAFDPKARRIYTVENGIAELSGDNKWKVITKAKIRYES